MKEYEQPHYSEFEDADFWTQVLLYTLKDIVMWRDFVPYSSDKNPIEPERLKAYAEIAEQNYLTIKEAIDSGKLPVVPGNDDFAYEVATAQEFPDLEEGIEGLEDLERRYQTELDPFGKKLIYQNSFRRLRWTDNYLHEKFGYEREFVEEKETIPKGLRQDVLQRDQFTCQHCGRKAPDVVLHIDHITPESKGGETILGNLQVLCEACNMGKGNRYDR